VTLPGGWRSPSRTTSSPTRHDPAVGSLPHWPSTFAACGREDLRTSTRAPALTDEDASALEVARGPVSLPCRGAWKTLNLPMSGTSSRRAPISLRPLFAGPCRRLLRERVGPLPRYPVVFMTFSDITALWPRAGSIASRGTEALAGLYGEHRYLLIGGPRPRTREFSPMSSERRATHGVCVGGDRCSRYCSLPVVLASVGSPVRRVRLATHSRRLYPQIRRRRSSPSSATSSSRLKDNAPVQVLTGILRVARESLFSGPSTKRPCVWHSPAEARNSLRLHGWSRRCEAFSEWSARPAP
jgi:hypothetical protein